MPGPFQPIRFGRFLLLALIGSTVAGELYAADRPVPEWPPRLWLNSDCGTPVFYRFDAPMSADQLCRVVDDLPGTAVDAFLPCPQFSDEQFWYPLESAEPYDGRQVPTASSRTSTSSGWREMSGHWSRGSSIQ